MDRWDSCCETKLVVVPLDMGMFYDIRIEYRELTGSASISLKWVFGHSLTELYPRWWSAPCFPSVLRVGCCQTAPPQAPRVDAVFFTLCPCLTPAPCPLRWKTPTLPVQVIPAAALFQASHIVGSPFGLTVLPGSTDFPFTTAFGPGLDSAVAGEPTTFIIQAKDQNGNNKTTPGDDDFKIVLAGSWGLARVYVCVCVCVCVCVRPRPDGVVLWMRACAHAASSGTRVRGC